MRLRIKVLVAILVLTAGAVLAAAFQTHRGFIPGGATAGSYGVSGQW